MRLPKIRQLTDEQKKVYLYSPTDRHVLVHGPPGTGKTLIACLRAIELQKKKVPVVLGMFNRVLARYSSNAAEDGDLPSQTVVVWFRKWWQSSRLPPHPNCSVITLQVPIAEKDYAKAAGARWRPDGWRPWGGGKGVWIVDGEKYFAEPTPFTSWRLWHDPPAVDGNPQQIDWSAAAKHILEHEELISDEALSLGNLLIDEGQDFPKGFYRTLWNISALAAARGRKVQHPPRCFVLADENQQLTQENSTLQEIAETLRIPEENRYLLLDNFRNSKEIALLARSFFADVGVLPRLPKRQYEKPVFSVVGKAGDVVERIRIWVTNNPGKEVGVLVFDEAKRAAVASALNAALGGIRGRSIKVQTYSWMSRQENPAQELLFDTPDVVTVLNMQSCKGLEFDAVFVVDLHQAQIGIYGPDRFKMQMFVAVSRGREWVQLIDSGPGAGSGPYVPCLPGEEVLEREAGSFRATGAASSDARQRAGGECVPAQPKEAAPSPAGGAVGWLEQVTRLARERALKIRDLRQKGGAFWVDCGAELAQFLEPLGFTYSQKRAAWWRKE